jgi:hypothetical protein
MQISAELKNIIKDSLLVVHKEKYAYLKADKVPVGKHFLISQDDDEITVVTTEAFVSSVPHSSDVKWFKLFEIKVSVPFLGVGFLAAISKAVAEEGLNILIVSTFSKDYVLVREETYEQALSSLQKIGFNISE